MDPVNSDADADLLDQLLAEYVEAVLAGGGGAAAVEARVPPQLRARFNQAKDNLRALMQPRRLGPYRLLEVLGSGGFAVVYLAEDLNQQQRVAVKVPHEKVLGDHHKRQRFVDEGNTLAALPAHPNIVRFIRADVDGAVPYLVSEYCAGPSLAQWLEARRLHLAGGQGPVMPAEAVAFLLPLAEAVFHINAHGTIHRDLKPSNVLLALPEGTAAGALPPEEVVRRPLGSFQPRLTDFGLAKVLARQASPSLAGDKVGTPAYMAPEQVRGRGADIQAATDVYGLGIVFYELLTGTLPFAGQPGWELENQIVNEAPPPPSRGVAGLSPVLEAICLRCLAKSPAQRYATARHLADDLRCWLDGRPTTARPLGLAAKAYTWCRDNRWPVLAALVTIAVLGVIAAQQKFVADAKDRALAAETANARVAAAALTNELVRAGDTAARLGAPEEARQKYRQAVLQPDLSPALAALLHTRMARMSVALDDMAAVKEELDGLEREPNLSAEARAAWRFEKALYLLYRSMETAASSLTAFAAETNPDEREALALLRQAAEDGALPEADRLTAHGLLAQSAAEALQRFREALELEPFHPYAATYFASTAEVFGQFEEALPQLEVWGQMSPRHPAPLLHKAAMLALLGRREEADQLMRDLEHGRHGRRKVSKATLASYRAAPEDCCVKPTASAP